MLQKAEVTKAIVEYDITNAAIAQMESIYMGLTITDLEDKDEFKAVHDARMVVKGHRVSVDKKRKELKKDALEWCRNVEDEAKRITGLLEPIETHLQAEENKVVLEQRRIEAEEAEKERKKRDKRFDDLSAVGVSMPIMEIAVLTDDEFQCLLDDKTFEFNEAQREKAEAEAAEKKRLAQEAADRKAESERLEKERVAQDAERERLEKIAADLAAADKARQAELDARQADIDAQTKAIQDEKDRIAKEAADKKAAEDAEIQAAKDAEDLAKHQAKMAAERRTEAENVAKRIEELRPDKDKLTKWIMDFNIYQAPSPILESNDAKKLFSEIIDELELLLKSALAQIRQL